MNFFYTCERTKLIHVISNFYLKNFLKINKYSCFMLNLEFFIYIKIYFLQLFYILWYFYCRVPMNGYYFFVFNSENEVQPNYVRVKFDLLKTVYNTSNSVHACKNSTKECSLPFTIFSSERTILELPLSGNDSQWNEEYIVVSTCEPRTTVYIICVIMVPLLILCFAFH